MSHGIQDQVDEASLAERYKLWMTQYGKVCKDDVEHEKHFQIFKHNVASIESSILQGKNYTNLALFADQPIGASDDGFKGVKGNCKNACHQVWIKSYKQVPKNSEDSLLKLWLFSRFLLPLIVKKVCLDFSQVRFLQENMYHSWLWYI